VLKYEQNDVVLSVALGVSENEYFECFELTLLGNLTFVLKVLEMFSVNEEKGWVKSYEEPKGTSSIICKVRSDFDLVHTIIMSS
jgi:hypothetical protein